MDKWLSTGSLKRTNADVSPSTSKPDTEKTQNKSKRKYSGDYLGFICVGAKNKQLPLCVVFSEILLNEALKMSKLRRHLETTHGEYVSKPIEFENKLNEYQRRKKNIETSFSGNDNCKAVNLIV